MTRRFIIQGLCAITSSVFLPLSGCHAPPVDYSVDSLRDGARVEIIPLNSPQGRQDEARGTNQFIYRFRVTPSPAHPVLRCELEYYKGRHRAKVPLAPLDSDPEVTGPLDVTISIKPMNTAVLGTGQMSYFLRIGDKSRTTTGSKIFRGMVVERLGARNLSVSKGDRWYQVAANRDPQKDSWHNSPSDDDAGIILHMTPLPKGSN